MPKKIADETVYDAALRVLRTHGYAGATTRRIAEAAGVNEATLFRKYGSKPALLTAAIRGRAFALPPGALTPSGHDTHALAADLAAAGALYAAILAEHGHLFATIMFEMARDPQLQTAAAGAESSMRALAALFVHYQAAGVLHTEESPAQLVAAYLGPLILTAMLQAASPSRAPAAPEPTAHTTRFLAGRVG